MNVQEPSKQLVRLLVQSDIMVGVGALFGVGGQWTCGRAEGWQGGMEDMEHLKG